MKSHLCVAMLFCTAIMRQVAAQMQRNIPLAALKCWQGGLAAQLTRLSAQTTLLLQHIAISMSALVRTQQMAAPERRPCRHHIGKVTRRRESYDTAMPSHGGLMHIIPNQQWWLTGTMNVTLVPSSCLWLQGGTDMGCQIPVPSQKADACLRRCLSCQAAGWHTTDNHRYCQLHHYPSKLRPHIAYIYKMLYASKASRMTARTTAGLGLFSSNCAQAAQLDVSLCA